MAPIYSKTTDDRPLLASKPPVPSRPARPAGPADVPVSDRSVEECSEGAGPDDQDHQQLDSSVATDAQSGAVAAAGSVSISIPVSRRSREKSMAMQSDETRCGSELGSGGRLATLTGVQVVGTGSFVPEEVVRNEDLAVLGYDADWILQRTGIRERRRAAAEMATSDVAVEAARRCLERADVRPADVDLVLVATMTPDMPSPSTACFVQQRLGLVAPAMDVSAACAGFMYALITGMQFVHSGCHRRVLVVGADLMTRIVDPADKKTFPLFGDGAGAVLLAPGSRKQGLLSYCLGADGRGADLLCTPAGGSRQPASVQSVEGRRHFLQMEGRAVFKWAVRMLSESVGEVLERAGLGIDDVDLTVWHQANLRILDAASSNLGLPKEKVLVNVDRFGNTSAGSIPLGLDEACREGRLNPGDRVLLSGFGAGLAWGTGVFQW